MTSEFLHNGDCPNCGQHGTVGHGTVTVSPFSMGYICNNCGCNWKDERRYTDALAKKVTLYDLLTGTPVSVKVHDVFTTNVLWSGVMTKHRLGVLQEIAPVTDYKSEDKRWVCSISEYSPMTDTLQHQVTRILTDTPPANPNSAERFPDEYFVFDYNPPVNQEEVCDCHEDESGAQSVAAAIVIGIVVGIFLLAFC